MQTLHEYSCNRVALTMSVREWDKLMDLLYKTSEGQVTAKVACEARDMLSNIAERFKHAQAA